LPRPGQDQLAGRMGAAGDQVQRQVLLLHVAGLAYRAAVETDEVALFAAEPGRIAFAFQQQRAGMRGELFEIVQHQATPPNTSTLSNRQGGDAWPTRITCEGSPLPQKGVPITAKLAWLPTAFSERQKLSEMPR